MNVITCIILDDEEISARHLKKFVEKIPFLKLESYFIDPNEAIDYLQTNRVDLIFLDIEMPNFAIDGMDFVKIMGDAQRYIFTTGHPEYALESYDYNAIDFLQKPISFERFSRAVQKVKALHSILTGENATDLYRYVRVDGRFHRIDFDSVCWVESDRSYVSIYTEQDRLNLHLSIGDLEAQLPDSLFVRIHKSYIVSKHKIDQIEANQVNVRRQHALKTLPLGESYRRNLLNMVEQQAIRKRLRGDDYSTPSAP